EEATIDVPALLEDVVSLVAPRAQAKGLDLVLQVDPALGPAVGDPLRLRQVVGNLVSNAVKFTETGEVIVRATRCAGPQGEPFVDLEVEDTGIGIDPEVLARLGEA